MDAEVGADESGGRYDVLNGKSRERKKMKKMKKTKDGKEMKGDRGAAKERGELPTVSIAVPGSIVDNAQSLELKTLLAGQIARAATIFRIDEVIIFDSKASSIENPEVNMPENEDDRESGASFLEQILKFLETPQYLRRRLFPIHNSLKYVGLLPPLDAPHHVRKHEWSIFREGVTLKDNSSTNNGTIVDVGLSKNAVVKEVLEPGIRVTVAMGTSRSLEKDCLRKIVKRITPGKEMGLYWGYEVRYARTLSCVFKNCPYKGGYDHVIGTSEHGLVIKSSELIIPSFRHLLIAFGGLGGLEESIEEDSNLEGKGVNDLFHSYLNTCPLQGSRSIRTEEAIFVSLQYFQDPIERAKHSQS